MSNILKNVDILDLVVINVFKGKPSKIDPYPLHITIDPIDITKKVEWDPSALKVFNQKLNDKLVNTDPRNPNTISYAKEFTGRMISELYKNGLVAIVDIPDRPDDPYAEAKKAIK